MAHIAASITVFKTHRHYICREGTLLVKRKDYLDALFLCRENGGQQVMLGIFMSTPHAICSI